ncbi:MAG: hypothetical protein M3361_15685 [Candidatus Tectomicrobia bacterium]|nr:hypothetical protein [Candidatus Tectomicrobia bacterium]
MMTRRHPLIRGLGFPVLLALLAGQVLVGGHDASAQPRLNPDEKTLAGTWRVEVTPVDCQTGVPTAAPGPHVVSSYVRGGTVAVSAIPVLEPAQGTPLSTGQGIWERTGVRRFRAFIIFLRFTPEGTLVGYLEVTHNNIQLGADADTFTVPVSRARILDVDGTMIATACGTVTGRRLTFAEALDPGEETTVR